MPRFFNVLPLVLLLGGFPEQVSAQNVDPARAKTLTVEQAAELLKEANSLRVDVIDLSPEVAAVLATYKGELRFEALTTLSPDTAAALATRSSGIDLPKISALSPAVAKALATTKGSLNLPGVKELPTNVARELAAHTGLKTLSGPSAVILRANEKIKLSANFQQP